MTTPGLDPQTLFMAVFLTVFGCFWLGIGIALGAWLL
jgi:hypothetical protein